jgi:hypothetical protein
MGLIDDIKYAVSRTKQHFLYRKNMKQKYTLTKDYTKKASMKGRNKELYNSFRLSTFDKLVKLGSVDCVRIRPKDSELVLYELLSKDEEFLQHYTMEVVDIEYNDIEFTPVRIDDSV